MAKGKKQRYSSAITLENAKKLDEIVKKSKDLNTIGNEIDETNPRRCCE